MLGINVYNVTLFFLIGITIDFDKLQSTIFDVLAFFGFVYLVGKFIVPHKKGIRYLFIVDKGNYAVLGVFILVFMFGDVAHILGFHPAIGAYFAELILKAEYFEVGNQNRTKEIEKITSTMAFTVFGQPATQTRRSRRFAPPRRPARYGRRG